MSNDFNNDLPNTLRALESGTNQGRPRVFEPALRHFSRAFKLGDYLSPSAHERLEWEMARAEVRTHLLQLISQSRWKEHLVLRGSVLMQAWFGEKARPPHDIDWVFQPQSVNVGDAWCRECLEELVELVKRNPRTPKTQIKTSHIVSDSIWTYERAEGRRIVFPFEIEGGGSREIQMDIVWGEELSMEPALTTLATKGGNEISLWSATRELSLAWKILWLLSDMHPQGKDLYDAVLLAESTQLPFDLLRLVIDRDEWLRTRPLTLDNLKNLDADWDNFKLEFPWIEGEGSQWEQRLIVAMAPTFVNQS